MRIAVIGATGQTGVPVTERIARSGHEVVAISREGTAVLGATDAIAADVFTGEGLGGAFDGCEVVVDVTNTKNFLDTRIFTAGAKNIITEAERAGVERAIMISVVGAEHSNFQYHQRKLDQERLYRESDLDVAVIRATQFFSFITSFFENGSAVGAIPVFLGARFQPVATDEVADLIATTAVNKLGDAEIAGPKVWVSRDLAKVWQAQTRARGVIVNGPFPPKLLDFFRSGENLSETAMQGAVTFQEWLSEQQRPTV